MHTLKIITLVSFFAMACTNASTHKEEHQADSAAYNYTCPMKQDSVFSKTPGKCPKCGMDLVPMHTAHGKHDHEAPAAIYTCPMHPEISKEKPGKCPICGMDLVQKNIEGSATADIELSDLLKPTNEFVISSIPVSTLSVKEQAIEIEALGNITYDTRHIGTISARISGRVEKLWVRYKYQKVVKGQKILEIYSPELVTAQQNLLFLVQNDPYNTSLIQAAEEKLRLLGFTDTQLQDLLKKGKASLTIPIYSNYTGHIHESMLGLPMDSKPGGMKDISLLTEELSLKEGMYVQKGQSVFSVFDPARAWAVLNIFGENQQLVKKGNAVRIVPETAPEKNFRARLDFIEPFYRKDSKTLTARVYFDNSQARIPIGSQVRALVFAAARKAAWLPKEAVLSLGLNKVVFKKTDGGFEAVKVTTGFTNQKLVQILDGLTQTDTVATNAQFLMDSESFIKIKN